MVVFEPLEKVNNPHEKNATVLYTFRNKRQFPEQRLQLSLSGLCLA